MDSSSNDHLKNYSTDHLVKGNTSYILDIKGFKDSIKDKEYANYITKKNEIILQSFKKINKIKDSYIYFEEVISFLDNNMKYGRKFDKETADKIMKMIDVDQDQQISLSEFARTYIQIEEELKMQIFETKINLLEEDKNCLNFNNLARQLQKEHINEYNLADNAKLNIKLISVAFTKNNIQFNNIFIKILYGSEIKKTSVLIDPKTSEFNENFEFKVTNLRDIVYYEIVSLNNKTGQEELIGKVKFPIDKLQNHDEIDIDIGIPYENGDGYLATIKTKIQFIRSFYKYYQSQGTKCEFNKKEFNIALKGYQKILHNLNEPFEFFSKLNNIAEFKKYSSYSFFDAGSIFGPGSKSGIQEIQEDATNNIESILKTIFNKPDIPWILISQLIVLFLIFLNFINILQRSDFLTIISIAYILIIYNTKFSLNKEKYINQFIIISAISTASDLFWLFICNSSSSNEDFDGNAEQALRNLILYTSRISLLLKFILTLILWILKVKINKGELEPLISQ